MGRWTIEEILILIEAWQRGEHDHEKIARTLPGRNAQQVGKELRNQGFYKYQPREQSTWQTKTSRPK